MFVPMTQALIVVEAMMNICGVALLQNGYGAFDEFNLRKFQATHCSSDNNNNNSSKSSSNTANHNNSSSMLIEGKAALNTEKEQEIEAVDT